MYTAPLEDIIEAHGLGRMIYADDTQVYVILKNDSDCTSIITKLERCINDIKAWSSANDLKLNEDKTEVIHVTSCFRKPSHLPFVNLADVPVQPVKSAHNLGVIFENDGYLYIQNICRSASYALYKIGRIRNYLDEKSTKSLIHAFITCRIDQCNSLLYGLPDSHIAKLQRIQNSAARLVTRTAHVFMTISPL